MDDSPKPEEFAALQQALADALRHNESLVGQMRVLRTERDLLKEQLNRFKRQLFTAKSEASNQHQKDMFFNEAEAAGVSAQPATEDADEDIDVPAHRRARRGRKPLEPALPREVVRHELPEGERVCPRDGARLNEIGVEVSEQLDIVPQQVRVIRHERVKYACPCCDGGMRVAAKPPQVTPKGLLSEAALAWVITSKYLDGLPLYRQAALLGRFGGTDLSRNTLAASVVRVGQAVQPVVNLLRDALLDAPIVHGDETELQVLKEPGRKAQAKSYVWVQMTDGSGTNGRGPPIRLFAYSPSRSTPTARQLYAGLGTGGVLMSDGYEPYNAVAEHHRLVHLGCWAHCRRYFRCAAGAAVGQAWAAAIAGALHRAHRPAVPCRGSSAAGRAGRPGAAPAAAAAQRRGAGQDAGVAAGAPARCAAGQPAGQGAALHGRAVAQVEALRRGRPLPDRQQRVRERDPALRRRPPELAVRGHCRRRQRQREPVLAAADLHRQRHRRLPLPQNAARRSAQGLDRRGLRRATALAAHHGPTLIRSRRSWQGREFLTAYATPEGVVTLSQSQAAAAAARLEIRIAQSEGVPPHFKSSEEWQQRLKDTRLWLGKIRKQDPDNHTLAFLHHGEPIGLLSIKPVKNISGQVVIARVVYAAADPWWKGAGGALVQQALRLANEWGCGWQLRLVEADERALAAWSRLGFEKSGTEMILRPQSSPYWQQLNKEWLLVSHLDGQLPKKRQDQAQTA